MRDQGETNSQEPPWGKALLPIQGIHTISLSCLQILKSFPSGARVQNLPADARDVESWVLSLV